MKHLYNRYGHPHRSLECLTVVQNPEREVCTIIRMIFNELGTPQSDGVNSTVINGIKGLAGYNTFAIFASSLRLCVNPWVGSRRDRQEDAKPVGAAACKFLTANKMCTATWLQTNDLTTLVLTGIEGFKGLKDMAVWGVNSTVTSGIKGLAKMRVNSSNSYQLTTANFPANDLAMASLRRLKTNDSPRGVNFSTPMMCNINVMNFNDLTTLRADGNISSKNPLKRVVH